MGGSAFAVQAGPRREPGVRMLLVGLGGPSVDYLEVSQGRSCCVHPKESKGIEPLD